MPHNFDQRLSRLEATVEAITSDVHGIRNLISKLSDQLGEGRKTNWSVLAAWGAVGLTLGSIVFNNVSSNQTRLEDDLKGLQNLAFTHMKDGHPNRVIEKIEGVEARLDRFEDRYEVRHKELDQSLQLADSNLTKFFEHRFGELSERLRSLETGGIAATANRFTRQDGESLMKRIERLEDKQ